MPIPFDQLAKLMLDCSAEGEVHLDPFGLLFTDDELMQVILLPCEAESSSFGESEIHSSCEPTHCTLTLFTPAHFHPIHVAPRPFLLLCGSHQLHRDYHALSAILFELSRVLTRYLNQLNEKVSPPELEEGRKHQRASPESEERGKRRKKEAEHW